MLPGRGGSTGSVADYAFSEFDAAKLEAAFAKTITEIFS